MAEGPEPLMEIGGGAHLTYCTNVHPGETWEDVQSSLQNDVLAVKRRCGVDRFGVGLRLSERAARELSAAGVDRLRARLDEQGLYVFTINGFPYGTFHGERVKERVYRPDWLEGPRLAYSDLLAKLLTELLPPGVDGSVSTVPGAFAPRAADAADRRRVALQLVRHAATLDRLQAETGRRVGLALEPEPGCMLETTADAVAFFTDHVFSDEACAAFEAATGAPRPDAESAMRRHLGLCLDACHAAVEFEDAADAVGRLRAAEIGVFKVQLSAGLVLREFAAADIEALARFDDGVYLHQVVSSRQGRLTSYLDLQDAFADLDDRRLPDEWRVHFHVPIFEARLGRFASTQAFLTELLALHVADPISAHLEVETYTWSVLPEGAAGRPLDASIAAELAWVRERLG